ncbi:TetR/AcrR family transcriptional regulator [Cryobacterium sp. PH29-G1]|uniref:TetR/AcrR family transcriptional regulator n=1 Tax=Cryobacterium sp. PH29-G1 TaxID=3046211 RepID=UPI0024BBA4A2|nr:TetR/AcrR family transcriptional regulator [Cryobacterium sp. PH29-G1]MDJ0348386.1 TetR/AcrR family transcriptional regulator [Cryobacterium sp. PH29-G1]
MAQTQRERAVRSDSIRNRDAILEAAATCLATNPASSIADIAGAAGVGRVTLYGHFSSRNALLAALLDRTMTRVESELQSVDLGGTPWQAMDALVASSWKLVESLSTLRTVVAQALPDQDLHGSHDRQRARVQELLTRGRAEGEFRVDHSLDWQTACYFAILHGAASEVRTGRLSEHEVEHVLPQTIRALLQVGPQAS